MKVIIKTIAAAMVLVSGFTSATLITDVKEYSNNTATEYFVDIDANKTNDPFYRDMDEDWGWEHNAISGTFASILLDISAYDVDFGQGELDAISIFDGLTWINMGDLTGNNNTWDFTQFDLSGFGWANAQVNAGLQVKLDIDTNRAGWLASLGKSVLSVNTTGGGGGGTGCVPTPGVPCETIPEPTTFAIFALGMVGLISRRFKKQS
jgi:hypothetical protein